MVISVLMMCAGSLMISLMPTYATIGAAAPIALLIARLVQGLSVGGEYGTAATYMSEVASKGNRGFYSSFQYVTLIGGQLLALLVLALLQALLTVDELKAWGWRIPFVIGALAAVVAMFLRRSLAETASAEAMHNKEAGSFVGLVRHHPRAVLIVLAFTMGGSLFFYTFTTYMQKYLVNTAHMDAQVVTYVMTVVLILYMLLQPLFGALSDRIGRRNSMILFTALGTLAAPPLLFALGRASDPYYAFILVLLALSHRELLHVDQRCGESRIVSDRSARAGGRPHLRRGECDVWRHRRVCGALAQVGRSRVVVCLVRGRHGCHRSSLHRC